MNAMVERQSDKDIAVLRWMGKGGEQLSLYLQAGEVIDIGREEGNDLQLMNVQVSRKHAVILWRMDAFQIIDLNSLNGTFVNSVKITDFHQLKDGDVINIYNEILHFYTITAPIPEVKQSESQGGTIIIPKRIDQPRLIVVSGEQEGRQIFLHSGKLVIGRASAEKVWDISIQDRAISRPHAEILQDGKDIIIADLKSTNGTLINGHWITEPIELENGDLIELGETLMLFRDR